MKTITLIARTLPNATLLGLFLAGCGRPNTSGPPGDSKSATPAAPATSESSSNVVARPLPGPVFLQAALDGKEADVRSALKGGTDAETADQEGRTALMLAAFNGHTEAVRVLLDAGATVDRRDAIGRTALMYAATGPNVAAVQLLLEKGASVNLTDGHENWTALMFAAAEGHSEVAQLLLSRGADASALDADGESAEHFARQRGHVELAELLRVANQPR